MSTLNVALLRVLLTAADVMQGSEVCTEGTVALNNEYLKDVNTTRFSLSAS